MKIILFFVSVFLSVLSYSQCLLIEVPLEQRTSRSELVIEGIVKEKRSFWNLDQTMIYTANTVEILKFFKGDVNGQYIEIITPGGTVGDKMIRVDPSLRLIPNETGIFMLEPVKRAKAIPESENDLIRFEPYAALQGFIKYDMQERMAHDPFNVYTDINSLYKIISAVNYRQVKPLVFPEPVRSSKIMAISGFSPATITSGTNSILTITGSGFGASQGTGVVRFRNADDGGATLIVPQASQYISWNDTEIQVEVPSDAGTGTIQVIQGASTFTSATPLTISFSHSNIVNGSGLVFQTDHVDINGSGGYTWQMNTAFDANTAAKNSFIRAFDTWRCGTNINWTIGATTSVNDVADDGINIICFDDDAPLADGFLGICYSYYSGCSFDGINWAWFAYELDIIFDEGSNIAPATWEFGTGLPSGLEYDFETVAVHELGHGHQLGHVISPGAIMHFSISNGTSNRSLSADDLAGGNFVQAKSEVDNICGPTAMSAYTGCSILPITITSINAFARNRGIMVEWNNTSETGVNYYELEESGDGISFSSAAVITPAFNNGNASGYNWFDQVVYNGSNFYRIKSVGYSGEYEYTEIVKVDISNNKTAFHIYPNPIKGNQFQIELNNLEKGNYILEMYNSSGQLILSRTIVHNGGSATEKIMLPAVSKGWYAFRLKGLMEKVEQRVLID